MTIPSHDKQARFHKAEALFDVVLGRNTGVGMLRSRCTPSIAPTHCCAGRMDLLHAATLREKSHHVAQKLISLTRKGNSDIATKGAREMGGTRATPLLNRF